MKDAYLNPGSAWFHPFVGGSYRFLSQPGVRNLAHAFFTVTTTLASPPRWQSKWWASARSM